MTSQRDKIYAATKLADITSGSIKDAKTGERMPCLRIHKDGDDPEDDMVIPLDKDAILALMHTLYEKYQELEESGP